MDIFILVFKILTAIIVYFIGLFVAIWVVNCCYVWITEWIDNEFFWFCSSVEKKLEKIFTKKGG